MKTLLLLVGTLVVFGGLLFIVWQNSQVEAPVSVADNQPVNPFPVEQIKNPQLTTTTTSDVPSPTISLQQGSGAVTTIPDFRRRADVEQDPNNPGLYYFSGRQTVEQPDVPYSLYYSDFDTSFTITLLRIPLAYYQRLAEQELQTKTGLTKNVLCTLKVGVYIPNYVDPLWGGQEVGLSFCPNAVVIP